MIRLRHYARIDLPPLSADQALQLVAILEDAITAIWEAHGPEMEQYEEPWEDQPPDPSDVPGDRIF